MMLSDLSWSALTSGIQGEVFRPGDGGYEWARKPFIARFDDYAPQAVVRCAVPADVMAALDFAKRHRLDLAVRSGGHCFAGYSSTTGLLIDVSPMSNVTVDGETAVVGAGTRVGALGQALAEHGRVVPSGSCPSVGIGGTALGGGLGVLGRMFGLTCDHMLSADIVLADGSKRTVDDDHDPDLFWALRGAGGGNFGVVTEFRFRTRPAVSMTNFYYLWPVERAVDIIDVWQQWAPAAPDEMAAGLALTATTDPAEPAVVEFYGAMAADESSAVELIDQFVDQIGVAPDTATHRELSYRETCLFQAGLLSAANDVVLTPSGPVERQGCRFTKSEFFNQPIPRSHLEGLVGAFVRDRRPGQFRGLELAPWLGQYGRIDPLATAFVHREHAFSLKHAILVDAEAGDGAKRAALQWVRESWSSVHGNGTGCVYPNFPDPDLRDWGVAYYGSHFQRLRQVKAKFDAENTFCFPQSIPVG